MKGLILNEIESLCAVEGELVVTRQQWQSLGDGVGDNHVVAGVAVVLSEVQAQVSSISLMGE